MTTPPPPRKSLDGRGWDAPPRLRPRPGFLALAGLAGLALLLGLHRGALGAPPISDDGAVLGYVHRLGAWTDWTTSQYDLRSVRFWRPLVTTSLGLQEAVWGADPFPPRLLNLFGQAATALLAGALAVRLGASRLGALLAALLVAAFPHQGGTVTWLVGRVDSLCLPWILGAVAAALMNLPESRAASLERGAQPLRASAPVPLRDRGPGPAWEALGLLCAMAALATKELAAVLPAFVFLTAWGAGCSPRAALRRSLPALFALGVVAVWRHRALGVWVGGYADGSAVDWLPTLGRMAGGWTGLALALGLLTAGPARFTAGARGLRATAAALGLALAARLPLVHLFATGPVAPEHLRTLALSDTALVLAVVVAFARPSAEWRRALGPGPARLARALPSIVLMALVAWLASRSVAARTDVERWAAAAELGEAHVARTRAALDGTPPSPHPVLDATFPRVHEGAYVLHWGVADRFRPPFPESPRPVWPWRTVFGFPGAERPQLVFTPRNGLVRPFGGAPRQVPELVVTVDGAPVERLALDERLFVDLADPVDRSPRLELWGDVPALRVEFLLYTELGYEPGVWLAPAPASVETGPRGVPESVRRISLREVFVQPGSAALFAAVAQAADLGAECAYLEVRAVDDARGVEHRPLAASRWIRLEWDAELRRRLWPR